MLPTMDSFLGRPFSANPSVASPERPSTGKKPMLLPPFEPLSSSPLPRPRSAKRKFEEDSPSRPRDGIKFYPTPVPTSSTGLLPSSPSARSTRPGLQRTMSTMSQRAALAAVPTVELPPTGETIRMGRSGNSSDYQLSTNRLISRVHVEATYQPPSASHAYGEIVISCLGWNGATVHCRGQRHELAKGDTFASDVPSAEIMLDVQDARVLIAFPRIVGKESTSVHNDSLWNEQSPSRRVSSSPRQIFASSPPPMIPQSPVSPTPARLVDPSASATFIDEDDDDYSPHRPIEVYKDDDSDSDYEEPQSSAPVREPAKVSRSNSGTTDDASEDEEQEKAPTSQSDDDFSDHNEENDPIIHSFGPFGHNLLPRMASFSTQAGLQSPSARPRQPLKSPTRSPAQPVRKGPAPRFNESPIKNHVINQLAFSRLHSIPISTIFGNLPVDLKTSISTPSTSEQPTMSPVKPEKLTVSGLKTILDTIPCLGEIRREGKDAAGKPLEDEFYYVPEMDSDQMRRDAVTGGIGGTGLRAVRRNHKQYYWKKPRH